MMEINIYTDGAASPNPGKGGAAAIIQWEHKGIVYEKKLQFYEEESTNQRMEIGAIIGGLYEAREYFRDRLFAATREEFKDYKDIIYNIYSDSSYCINCMNQKWYNNWNKNGWLNAKKQPVANKELWMTLLNILNNININDRNKINFIKVKGHSDNELNNSVDALAVEARKSFKGMNINYYID